MQIPGSSLFPTPAARACVIVSLLLVAACGQRGPLYLPERTPIVVGDPQDEDAARDAARSGGSADADADADADAADDNGDAAERAP